MKKVLRAVDATTYDVRHRADERSRADGVAPLVQKTEAMKPADVQTLQGILERLYPDAIRARTLASSVGVNERLIAWGGATVDMWASVMAEVGKQGTERPYLGLCLAAVRDDGTGAARDLLRALWGFQGRPAAEGAEVSSPFRGLRPYEAKHASVFCGRDEQALDVLLLLEESGRVIVSGEIGTGKSSLAMAGVIARVVAAAPDGDVDRPFTPLIVKPGPDPWERTEAAARAAWPGSSHGEGELSEEAIVERLHAMRDGHNPADLWNLLTDLARTHGRVVVLVDQMEELFTYGTDDPRRRAYVASLAYAFSQRLDVNVRLLATVRSDVLPAVLALPAWREPCAGELAPIYTLGPMAPDALATAIREPARRRGVDVEDALVTTVTREAGQTTVALPLVSAVLDAIWRRRQRRDAALTVGAYRDIGGIQKALDTIANQFWQGCTEQERKLLDAMLPALVDQRPEGVATRRRVLLSELIDALGDRAAVKGIVDRLEEERLLVALAEADVVRVELAHDALIQNWAHFDELIKRRRDALVVHHQLRQAVAAWRENPRALWSWSAPRERARAARDYAARGLIWLTSEEQAFLRRSSRARALAIGAGASAAAAALLSVLAAVLTLARAQHRSERAEQALTGFVTEVTLAIFDDPDPRQPRPPVPLSLKSRFAASLRRLSLHWEDSRDASLLEQRAQWLMRAGLIYTKSTDFRTSTETLHRARSLYLRSAQARDRSREVSACERHRQLSFTCTLIGNNHQNVRAWEQARRAHEDAVRFADEALALSPCSSADRGRVMFRRMQARLALGSALAEGGDLQRALEVYTAAQSLPQADPGRQDAALTLRLAAVHWRLGHATEAHQLSLLARDLFTAAPEARFLGGAQYATLLSRESERPLSEATHAQMRFEARPTRPVPGAPTRCAVELTGPLVDNPCFPRCRVRAACDGEVSARAFNLRVSCVNCSVSPPVPARPGENTIAGFDAEAGDIDGDGYVRFDTGARRITLSPPRGAPLVDFDLFDPAP